MKTYQNEYTCKVKRNALLRADKLVFSSHNQKVSIKVDDIIGIYDTGNKLLRVEAIRDYTFPMVTQKELDKVIRKYS